MYLEPIALKLVPFDLKYGFADFPLIGVRAAPENKVILRPLEQNRAPERYKYMDTQSGRSGASKWQEPFQQPQAGPEGEGHGCP
jgi:hypothetical protein